MDRCRWLLLSCVLVALLAGLAQTAWAQAPAGIYVFYEAAQRAGARPNADIRLQRLTLDGQVGWGDKKDARPVASSAALETAPAACSDGEGGAIVAYQYQFVGGEHAGDSDIVAQRVDAAGKLLWNKGDEPVGVGSSDSKETRPVIVPDGHGGAFIVFEWQDADGDFDLMAQRVDAEGNLLWNEGDKSVPVANSPSAERGAVVVPDGQGGLYVVFAWTDDKGAADVMAQRVSADGELLWNEGKQATDIAATDDLERHPAVASDGQGGLFIVYDIEYVAGELKGDMDIVAQRLAADGSLAWEEPADVGTSKGLDRNPVVVSDRAGGVIVVFEHEALDGEFKGDVDILGQRLSSDGTMLWKEGQESVIVATAKQLEWAPQALALDHGGALVVFNTTQREGVENAGALDLMAQLLMPDGEIAWNEGKQSSHIASSKWQEQLGLILPDGKGGLVCVFVGEGPKGGKFEGDTDVSAMRLGPDGKMMWNDGERAAELGDTDLLERNPSACVVSWK
jgi:hypothetical protein